MELDRIKQNVSRALGRLGISQIVSLDEIEREISQIETVFQSLLLLGILSRIMHNKDDKAAELFISAVTEWKNHLPHQDLDGLSPTEMQRKYPPGPHEARFIRELLDEYQERLKKLEEKAESPPASIEFDIESDFIRFQNEYFKRIPYQQPFFSAGQPLMTIKEIIIEERRQRGRPEKDIDKIGIKIFAENTAEGLETKVAAIEDRYFSAVEELAAMQKNPKLRSRAKVRAIRKQFEQDEPYHRCGINPHQFYFNYAMVVFLDSDDLKLVISLLDRALSCKPDYKLAIEMKRRLKKIIPDKNKK